MMKKLMTLPTELHVADARERNNATTEEDATRIHSHWKPGSLKLLASQVIERNRGFNTSATGSSLTSGVSQGDSQSDWRRKAEFRIEGRLKGTIEFPLSEEDAEIYRRLMTGGISSSKYVQ